MKNWIAGSERVELNKLAETVKALVVKKSCLSEQGQRVLSAVHNYQHCDISQRDHFRQRLIVALEGFNEQAKLHVAYSAARV